MITRTVVAAVIGAALIGLPVLVMDAQSEESTDGATSTVESEQVTVQEDGALTAFEEESSDQADPSKSVAAEPTASEAADQESEEPGAEDTSGNSTDQASATVSTSEQAAEVAATETTTVLPSETVAGAVASSTASSTPPADPPVESKEDPYVLQPAVKLDIGDRTIAADITLENLTCRRCDKTFPEVAVEVYYTAWYSNDGPEVSETGARLAEQTFNTSQVAPWGSERLTWLAEAPAPGHYYFVVIVNPQNEHGAYRLFRSEFSI